MIGLSPKSGTMNVLEDLIDIVKDPKKYKAKVDEFTKRETESLKAAEIAAKAQAEAEKAKKDLLKEETRLNKEVKFLKKNLDEELDSAEQLKKELEVKIQAEKISLAKKEADLKERENKVLDQLKTISAQEAGFRARETDLKAREEAVQKELAKLMKIKNTLSGL